jgi:ASC-1-like (ASCH) protein
MVIQNEYTLFKRGLSRIGDNTLFKKGLPKIRDYIKIKNKYIYLKKMNINTNNNNSITESLLHNNMGDQTEQKISLDGGAKTEKRPNQLKRETKDIKPDYTMNLSEPWFTLITLGLKTVEGRLNKGRFKEMKVNDILEWQNEDFKPRKILTRLTSKKEYSLFEEYLKGEGLDKCLPGMPTIDHGLSVYYKYYKKEDEKEFGVVAIRLELLNDQ